MPWSAGLRDDPMVRDGIKDLIGLTRKNVKDHGAKGDGINDDTAAVQAAYAATYSGISGNYRGEVFFEPGVYKITAPIVLNDITSGDFNVSFVGSGAGTTWLQANFAGYVFDRSLPANATASLSQFSGMRISNTHASGGGIRFWSTGGLSIDRCLIEARTFGINTYPDVYLPIIANTILRGIGGNVGTGLFGTGAMIGCDVIGWNEGIRSIGQLSFINGRVEQNAFGIRFGLEEDGDDRSASNCLIETTTFESNGIAIDAQHLVTSKIGAISIQGSLVAPPGGAGSTYGIRVHHCAGNEFGPISIQGEFSQHAILIDERPVRTSFRNTTAANSGAGGLWSLPSDTSGLELVNCSGAPENECTLAQLASYVAEHGDFPMGTVRAISNSNTATPGAEIITTGAHRVLAIKGTAGKWFVATPSLIGAVPGGGGGDFDLSSIGIFNVKDYGAIGDGIADDTPAIQATIAACIAANGGEVYFPANPSPYTNHYRITAPLTVSGVDSKQVRLVGEKGVGGYGSKIFGNFAGYLIDHTNDDQQMLAGVSGLVLNNSNAAGGAIRVENSQQCIIEHVYIQAPHRGVFADQNAYNTHIRNSVIGGLNNAVGSIGIMASQVIVSECSIVGWDEGVRAHNAGFCLENNRLEMNLIGVRLGVSPIDAGSVLGGTALKANSFERNNTGILIDGVGGCSITGNFVTGTENVAANGECQYGIRAMGGCHGALIAGNTVAGTFEQAAYSLEHNYSDGTEAWIANISNNASALGGVHWKVNNPHGKKFIANAQLVDITTTTGNLAIFQGCHTTIHTNVASPNILYLRMDAEFTGYGGLPPIGTTFTIRQLGAGQTSIVADDAVIILSHGDKKKLADQYAEASLTRIAPNTWLLSGDLVA